MYFQPNAARLPSCSNSGFSLSEDPNVTSDIINDSSFSVSPLCKCINYSGNYLLSHYNYLVVKIKDEMKVLAVLFCEIQKQIFCLREIPSKHTAYTLV